METTVEKIKKKKEREQEMSRSVISFNELLKMEANDEPFLLYGLIVEGGVNALTSDSGKGKSLLMLKMIEAIVTGEKFLGEFETKKSKTLILDLEMSMNSIILRAKSVIGREIEGLDIYCCKSFNIFDENDFGWLKSYIKEHKYELVVLDTYSMGVPSKNENDNAEANKANAKFLELVNELKITILFLHHHRKLQKGEVMSQSTSRGAGSIIDKTSSQILLDTKDITILDNKSNAGGLKGIRITGEQTKRREAIGFSKFAVKVWYNPFEKKSHFEFDGYDQKADSALMKTKNLILGNLEPGEEYLMKDIKKIARDSRCVYSAVKELMEVDKILTFRLPEPNEEMENGHKIPSHTKIYYLQDPDKGVEGSVKNGSNTIV